MTKVPRVSGNTMINYLIKKNFFIASRKGGHAALGNQRVH